MRGTMSKADDFTFYDRFYKTVRATIARIIARRFNFSGETLPQGLGPRFILCNHNTDADFLFLVSVSEEPMDFVATEAMMRIGPLARWAAKTFKPILHDKGSKGVSTLKSITERIRAGRSVMLFPEGNRSFDGKTGEISDAIGKIAKMTGATLVIYRLTGGYLTNPRWGKGIRKGKMEGYIARTVTPEELKKMPASEILEIIREGLFADAYKEQERTRVRFRNPNRAQYLETLLFCCPSCKRVGAMHSLRDKLSCSCGYELSLDEYGYLSDEKNEPFSITDACNQQKELFKELLMDDENKALWQDEVAVSKVTYDHKTLDSKKSTLLACHDHLMLGEECLEKSVISSVDIVQRNRLSIHETGKTEHYEITGGNTFNAFKYLLWYQRSYS
jgi:1-acyl-sn-glycerol-3-phosphate acyltransferase